MIGACSLTLNDQTQTRMIHRGTRMKKRIIASDVLRGFALLAILLMNIMSFAMPDIAYSNPTTYGGGDVWNQLVYGVTHLNSPPLLYPSHYEQ